MQESARRLALLAALAGLFAGAGCTRKFFRDRADKDVEGVITQKNLYPNWAVKNWFVYPHPDARFADPFNPDRPLYPADDPAARLLSPNPQHPTKRTGVGRVDGVGYLRLLQEWDAENRIAEGKPAPGAAMGQNDLPLPEMDVNVRPASLESDRGVLLTPDARHASDAAQWVAAKPHSVLAPAVGPRVGPRIVEPHGALLLASGHGTEDGKVVPAMASTAANDPPTVLPEISTTADPLLPDPGTSQEPKKLPDVPKVGDDKGVPKKDQMPSGDPLITMGGTESDYLRALQSNQLGYLIRLEQAVGLGLINSREFQDRREDLYLAALQVTLSRFNFATQAFFTEQAIRNFVGSNLSGAGRFWSLNTNAGLSKNFATGASLLVKAANQIVIDLGSMKPDIAVSNLSMSFIQPFLRGGGLAVNLEDLTFNERNMLYAMRSYARFRKIFYATVAAGSNGGNLNITNNPYGLQGLSVNLGRGIGGNLTSPVIGFLPLLLQSAVIANNRKNVAFLETLLKQYQAYVEGGQLSDLQAGQVEVQLLGSRGNLLGNVGGGGGGLGGGIRGYLDSLDNFKLQLGLPMTVGLDLDEFALSPIRKILSKFEDIYTDIHNLEALAGRFDPKLTLAQQRERWRQLFTQSDLVKGTAFAKAILDRWDSWAKLSNDEITARIAKLSSERNAILDRRAERQLKSVPEPETEIRRLEQINSDLELGAFERAVRVYEGQVWLKEPPATRQRAQELAFRKVVNSFFIVVLGARNERLAATRSQWPDLPTLPVEGLNVLATDLDTAYTASVQAALSNRLDLMNARGQVVDAYRQIAVTANALQGVFNVEYDYNATTPPGDNRPFAYSANRSSQQLVFSAQLPLVRRAERNAYRAALIGYQRQRRTLMAFEDNIANDVRSDIRQLRTTAELYKIQQRLVELGYSQVDNAREQFFAPLAANTTLDPAAQAALTQQLLQFQSNLLSAQNTLFNIWVGYLTVRMQLYLDLELMQLDDRGVWIDEQAPGKYSPPQPGAGSERERLPLPKPVDTPAGKP